MSSSKHGISVCSRGYGKHVVILSETRYHLIIVHSYSSILGSLPYFLCQWCNYQVRQIACNNTSHISDYLIGSGNMFYSWHMRRIYIARAYLELHVDTYLKHRIIQINEIHTLCQAYGSFMLYHLIIISHSSPMTLSKE